MNDDMIDKVTTAIALNLRYAGVRATVGEHDGVMQAVTMPALKELIREGIVHGLNNA